MKLKLTGGLFTFGDSHNGTTGVVLGAHPGGVTGKSQDHDGRGLHAKRGLYGCQGNGLGAAHCRIVQTKLQNNVQERHT